MEDLFARIILGHLVGDYLFQNKAMMLRKSRNNFEGFFWCTLHCLIYAATVCLFLWTANVWVFVAVFLSHWPIDRWSLAAKWMRMIKGRDLKSIPAASREIDTAFYSIVYAATDNTMHMLLVWLAMKWLVVP